MSKNINGHAEKKRDVLLSNSPLPEKAKSMLSDYWLPPPMKQQVENAQNSVNAITAKEMEIADMKAENNRLLYYIVTYGNFMADTLPVYRDSVISVLDNEQGFDKDRFFIPVLIKTGQYETATEVITDLETYANTLPDAQRLNLIDFCNYLKVVKRYVQNNYDQGVIKQYRSTLERWAKRDNSPVQIGAQILLEQGYPEQYDYPEKIEFPGNITPKSFLEAPKNQSASGNFIQAYPNPANNLIIVKYQLPETIQNCSINLYDVNGHLLASKDINKYSGILHFDTTRLPDGNYFISFCQSGKKDYVKQISIAH